MLHNTGPWPYDVHLAHTGDTTTRDKMIAAADARVDQARNELSTLHLIAAAHHIRGVLPTVTAIVLEASGFDRDEPNVLITDLLTAAGTVPQDAMWKHFSTVDKASIHLAAAFTDSMQFGDRGGIEYRDDLDDPNSYETRHYQVTIDTLPGFDGSTLTWHTMPDESSPHVGDTIVHADSRIHTGGVYQIGRGHIDRSHVTLFLHPGGERHLGVHTTLDEAKTAAEQHEHGGRL